MKKTNTAVLMVVVLLLAGTAWAGVIAPGLESQMQSLSGDDEVKVLVVLRDQADIDSMNRQLHDSRATRQQRHEAVLGALQDAAHRSQVALTDHLQARQSDGGIRGYTPHWLINAVVVVGTVVVEVGAVVGAVSSPVHDVTIAATRAATPAVICTTVPPAKSYSPMAPSQPPPQTQWVTGTYTSNSQIALNSNIAENFIRSAKPPMINAGVMIAKVI